MTEERPTVEPVVPFIAEPVILFLLVAAVFVAIVVQSIRSDQLRERTRELPESSTVSASTTPSTLISRNALYISEVFTDDPVEQEEIDRAFDVFYGRSGGLGFSVLSLWDVYDYLVVKKVRSDYYDLFFSNLPPVWRVDEKTKRRELHIDGQQLWVTVWNEKTYEDNKPRPSNSAYMVKVGVNFGNSDYVPPKEGWIRYITTKDFRINSYGEKYPRTDRVELAKFFGGKYPSGKKTLYIQVTQ